jgi:hypothetical protein
MTMGNRRIQFLVLAGLLAAGVSAGAQAPGPAGSVPRGFSSQILVAQLSLYVPEEATRGMYRGFGGRGAAAGGQSGQAQPGGAGGASGAGRPFPLQFTRDPKLYLTRAQITGLLPILSSLRDSPLPAPTRAKQVQAAVDGILTEAQKAEWTEFQKKMQELIAQFRQQAGANGTGGQGAMNGDGAAQAGGPGGPGGAPQATLLQRRQRQLDAFIKVLQDRLNAVGV